MDRQKIKSFTDLKAWQEGHKLVLEVYKASHAFPSAERFSLANQLQRAAVSITSNIAEGFSRRSSKEKVQFFYTALSSLTEVQNQLLIAKDLRYMSKDSFNGLAKQAIRVHKILCGLIKSAKSLSSLE